MPRVDRSAWEIAVFKIFLPARQGRARARWARLGRYDLRRFTGKLHGLCSGAARRETAEACGKWRRSVFPPRSERAGQHSRECVSVRCGLRRHGAVAQGGLRWRCGGRRMRIAAAPVLPDGGRPVGTAWKDFESGVSSPVLPPASRRVRRRCDYRGGFARRGCGIAAPQCRGICGFSHFPSRSRRERASAADAF